MQTTDDYQQGFKAGQLAMLFNTNADANNWPMTRSLLLDYQRVAASRARGEVLDAIQQDAVLTMILPVEMLNRITEIIDGLNRQGIA